MIRIPRGELLGRPGSDSGCRAIDEEQKERGGGGGGEKEEEVTERVV